MANQPRRRRENIAGRLLSGISIYQYPKISFDIFGLKWLAF